MNNLPSQLLPPQNIQMVPSEQQLNDGVQQVTVRKKPETGRKIQGKEIKIVLR
jgi:hypothetical protein